MNNELTWFSKHKYKISAVLVATGCASTWLVYEENRKIDTALQPYQEYQRLLQLEKVPPQLVDEISHDLSYTPPGYQCVSRATFSCQKYEATPPQFPDGQKAREKLEKLRQIINSEPDLDRQIADIEAMIPPQDDFTTIKMQPISQENIQPLQQDVQNISTVVKQREAQLLNKLPQNWVLRRSLRELEGTLTGAQFLGALARMMYPRQRRTSLKP